MKPQLAVFALFAILLGSTSVQAQDADAELRKKLQAINKHVEELRYQWHKVHSEREVLLWAYTEKRLKEEGEKLAKEQAAKKRNLPTIEIRGKLEVQHLTLPVAPPRDHDQWTLANGDQVYVLIFSKPADARALAGKEVVITGKLELNKWTVTRILMKPPAAGKAEPPKETPFTPVVVGIPMLPKASTEPYYISEDIVNVMIHVESIKAAKD